MVSSKTVNTTCPYCGTGCGIQVELEGDKVIRLQGDLTHPANLGRLCSKGAALEQTLDLDGRLLHPQVDGIQVDWSTALDRVADDMRQVIEQHGPDAVAFYLSGQLLTEDYYVANKLMKGFIGSANVDTNSRLCMASTVAGYKRAFGSDTVPCSYEDLERAKLVVLVGSNTAWCHPVLYQRLVQAKKEHPDLLVVVIDPRRTESGDIADLYLPLRPGSDAYLFNGLLTYLLKNDEGNPAYIENFTEGMEQAMAAALASAPNVTAVAKQCGLQESELKHFYDLFARTERVVTVFSQGINQSSSGTDKVNAIINCHLLTGRIGRPGMGPFSLTGQPNAMGGREVGGLANQLAAHMEIGNAEHRDCVQRFWNAPNIVTQNGLKAVEMFDAIADGRIKFLWIMGTNPAVSLPDADKVKQAIEGCPHVVVSDCMANTDTTRLARVLLPALAWGEKDGTVTNSERRISRQRSFLPAPGEARADWWIIGEVAKRLGFTESFNFDNNAQIFREHAALSVFENNGSRDFDLSGIAMLSDDAYDALQPVQWPVNAQGEGQKRMFSDGRFFTASGKARFIPVQAALPVQKSDSDYPLLLNTGRVRDQWHTMTRTGKSARLGQHQPEPSLQIHATDAARYAIGDGALVRVRSRYGEIVVRAVISDSVQAGNPFVPMHWNDHTAARARVDSVMAPVTDPVSGQPELKYTPVSVETLNVQWSGQIFSRRRLSLPTMDYWSVQRTDYGYRYYLAGSQTVEDWSVWARALLCIAQPQGTEWIEYFDNRRNRYRGARITHGQLESYVEIGGEQGASGLAFVNAIFNQPTITNPQRQSLLMGRPADAANVVDDKIVCACFGVGQRKIEQAIADGCDSVEAIGARLKAGTNCGSCLPELRRCLQGSKTETV